MPKLRRRLTTIVMSAFVVTLLVPAIGEAATNFGSALDHDPANSGECERDPVGPCTIVSSVVPPNGPEGAEDPTGAPVDGVITKFRIRAYMNEPGQVTFRVGEVAPSLDGDSALANITGTGPTVSLPTTESIEAPVLEFSGRVPVKKGQHLALTGTNFQATINDSGQEYSYVYKPPLAEGTAKRDSFESTGELLVAATIEPDADGDGFGDETQDGCPTQAVSQGACDTTKPGVTGFGVANGKITYTLSEAATVKFQLAKKLPGRKAGKKCVKKTPANAAKKKCTRLKNVGAMFDGTGKVGKNSVKLPNGKNLKPGKYKLTMTATDAAGNVTTASTNFKVAKKKKKK